MCQVTFMETIFDKYIQCESKYDYIILLFLIHLIFLRWCTISNLFWNLMMMFGHLHFVRNCVKFDGCCLCPFCLTLLLFQLAFFLAVQLWRQREFRQMVLCTPLVLLRIIRNCMSLWLTNCHLLHNLALVSGKNKYRKIKWILIPILMLNCIYCNKRRY